MGYERTLLTRWTRRDWLAIAVIALTTTFLVGTSTMILATGSQIDGEVQALDALETAEFTDDPGVTAGGGDVTLPVAQARTANGTNVTVVGLPEATVNLTSSFDDATLANPPPSGVVEHGTANRSTVRLVGASGNATLEVREASNRSVLPKRWYSAQETTVQELGRTGRFTLDIDAAGNATNTSKPRNEGALLLGTPGFLTTGGSEIVELLGLITLASGLLIGVTVYSVTRMTVRDRRRSLFVIRSTGGTRRRLVGLFGVRAALLTAVGAAFGYAIGIILINAVINVATYYGTLTTIDVSGSPTDRLVLGAILITVVAIGLVAGGLSVIRTVAAPPASLMGTGAGVAGSDGLAARVQEALGVNVIGLRTVVPMTAALTVLIAIAVVSVSVGLTLAPLAGATDGVVMSPDASYPLQSQVDEDLVRSFRAAGIPASPEVLLPQVRDGQPYVMRGVNYSAYRQVSDVSLTAGREPVAIDEALIGEGLARTLDVGVGDTMTVGGGTAFGIDRVTVVGRFDGEGYLDDQLLISLQAGKQLANLEDGSVQIIRTTGIEEPPDPGNETPTPTPTPAPADIVVTDVSVPETGILNRPVPIEVTVENRGDLAGNRTLTVPVNGSERNTTVTVGGRQTRTVTLSARFQSEGTYTITVGGRDADVEIIGLSPADIVITDVSVPETAPVNTSVPVDITLENRGGRTGNRTLSVPVNGSGRETTVTIEGAQVRTVSLSARFRSTGEYNITVGGVDGAVEIVEPPRADVVVTDVDAPETAFVEDDILVTVTVENRGNRVGNITLTTPVDGAERDTNVTVESGEERTVTLVASYETEGTYELTIGDVVSEIRIIGTDPPDVIVRNVSAPPLWRVDAGVPIEVTVENRGDLRGNLTLSVPVNGSTRETTVAVNGSENRTVTLTASFRTPGAYSLTIGNETGRIRVVDPGNVSLSPLPARAPPNATLLVTARNRTNGAVPGLQFRLGEQRARTGPNGTARIRVPGNPGGYQLESVIGGQVVHNRSLEVGTGVERTVLTTIQVRPEQVSFRGDAEVTVTTYNPWGTALRRELVIRREGESVFSRTVQLVPGEETTVTTSVDPAPTGETQRVQVVSDGVVLGEATFTIDVSDRALATLARLGLYQPGSGLTRSLDSLLGNFQVLQGALLVLSFLVGIGSTATVVIQATHARRRTIGIRRVTGAAPRDVVGMLLGDGLRVGAIASAIGVVSAYVGLTLLVEVGYAVLFGVRIPPLLNPWLVLGVFGGALVVVAASSVIAAWWVLRVSPGALVTASTQRVPDQDDGLPSHETEVEG
ncbi:MAG: FtsX-like permease family protein [Halobacteriales archaeon]